MNCGTNKTYTITPNACYQIATRSVRFDDPLTSLLFTAGVGAAVTSFMLPGQWSTPDMLGWALLIGSGAAGCLGHLFIIWAFRAAPASVVIEVTDNGPGLPLHALRSIFDPFVLEPGEDEQFGLRLMTVYFLVHHHGGHVEVTSTGDSGSTIRITLPVSVAASETAEDGSRDFVTKVLMNDALWERLLAQH